MQFVLLLGLLVLVAGNFLSCVSQSLPGQRFSESSTMSAPTNSVVLADPNNFSFAFVGDLHIAGAETSRLSRILAASAGDDFQIFLGDMVDEGVEEDFQAFNNVVNAAGWNGRMFPAIGNHDIFYRGWEFYKQYLGPSHYTFTVGNSKFIVVDTADGTLGQSQIQWLEQTLAESRPTHLFIVSHYLPVIPGVQTYLKLANQEEAIYLMKLAKNHNVTAWIGGHYHSYVSESIDGVQYVVAGGGGGRRMGPVESYFYVQASVSPSAVNFEMQAIE